MEGTTMLPKLRGDLAPLCCIHHKPMIAPDATVPTCVCTEPDCGISWYPVRGYEKYVGGPFPVEQLSDLVFCRQVGHGCMFISEFDPATRMQNWHCAIDGCSEQKEITEREWEPKYRYQQLHATNG